MNKKGFTLIELLAVLVVLGIVVGISLVSIRNGSEKAKKNTEEIFIGTIKDALNIYLDTDAKRIKEWTTSPVCIINKSNGQRKVYKADKNLTFEDVIKSSYSPITYGDLVNPAKKDTDDFQCFKNGNYGELNIYRDEDYVYYYKIEKKKFGCLSYDENEYITNFPSGSSCLKR